MGYPPNTFRSGQGLKSKRNAALRAPGRLAAREAVVNLSSALISQYGTASEGRMIPLDDPTLLAWKEALIEARFGSGKTNYYIDLVGVVHRTIRHHAREQSSNAY